MFKIILKQKNELVEDNNLRNVVEYMFESIKNTPACEENSYFQ